MDTITRNTFLAHGLTGSLAEPDWPRLTLGEADQVLRGYPQARGARELLSFSPRPFSAASIVAASSGNVFLKRHHNSVRDREGLLEEHRLMEFAADKTSLVPSPLRNADGSSVTSIGDWTYEVYPVADGEDWYEEALSWTPFQSPAHARAAGLAMARLHQALKGYDAPRRRPQQLVSSFTIFARPSAGSTPDDRMRSYLAARPLLRQYAQDRNWHESFDGLMIAFYRKLERWLQHLEPQWTHNDFHASNLMWKIVDHEPEVSAIVDFGLSDRTTAMHDLATAIERNIIEWRRLNQSVESLVHFDHLDALIAGYEKLLPLSYEEARALAAILPIVHCEFALSEANYFLSILHSEDKAYLAYEGYFLAHAEWFQGAQGRRLIEHLEAWAENKQSSDRGNSQ